MAAARTAPTASTVAAPSSIRWTELARGERFRALTTAKRRFVVPATIFFVAFYFALPCLCGFAPRWMATKVIGAVNLAYLFALAQFAMTWIVAALYVRAAAKHDELAARVVAESADASAEGTPSHEEVKR